MLVPFLDVTQDVIDLLIPGSQSDQLDIALVPTSSAVCPLEGWEMASLHLDKARRELRTSQPRAADEHHQHDSLSNDETQESINLLSVAFRRAPEPVLEYSFEVLSYSFAPFFVCLLGPWLAVVSLSKTALS
jgi:hypothetical protein